MGEPLKYVGETSDSLVKLVGYDKIIAALDVSRSTIERAVKAGELPPPRNIRGRKLWLASEINAWATALFEGRLSALDRSAETNPDNFEPEELATKAHKLAVLAVSKFIGEPVVGAEVEFSYKPKLSTEEERELHKAHTLHLLEALEPLFADFNETRAAFIVAWMFPSLRQSFNFRDDELGRQLRDPETLRRFAMNAMDDDEWAEAQSVVRKRLAKPGA